MNHFSALRMAVAAAAVLVLPLAQAATMSRTEFAAAKSRIGEAYKADQAACDALRANAKDICVEQAKAKEKVARAELEFSYTGRAQDGTKAWIAKADAAYSVAKEKCDDLSGNSKDLCREQAKTNHLKALVDAKMGRQIAQARTDAVMAKRDADYKLAAEKCNTLSGDAKSQCLDNARRTFGNI